MKKFKKEHRLWYIIILIVIVISIFVVIVGATEVEEKPLPSNSELECLPPDCWI